MKTKKTNDTYTEWLSAEEMHADSIQWMSALKFARYEQQFLNNLVRSNTLHLLNSEMFDESKRIIDAIVRAEKDVLLLLKTTQSHENKLEVLVNDIDEPEMEKAYRKTHKKLHSHIKHYISHCRTIKTNLFKLVSKVMKKQKQKRLLT